MKYLTYTNKLWQHLITPQHSEFLSIKSLNIKRNLFFIFSLIMFSSIYSRAGQTGPKGV